MLSLWRKLVARFKCWRMCRQIQKERRLLMSGKATVNQIRARHGCGPINESDVVRIDVIKLRDDPEDEVAWPPTEGWFI